MGGSFRYRIRSGCLCCMLLVGGTHDKATQSVMTQYTLYGTDRVDLNIMIVINCFPNNLFALQNKFVYCFVQFTVHIQ